MSHREHLLVMIAPITARHDRQHSDDIRRWRQKEGI
jgi:hypothetical protein